MSKYGTGMRNCCDSLQRGNHPHIIGCEQYTPQDSQTLTADERLREAAQAVIKSADEFAAWIALGTPARYLVTPPDQAEASRAMDALRAALNQGQG